MLWVFGHYNLFILSVWGPSLDLRLFWHLKTVPVLNGLRTKVYFIEMNNIMTWLLLWWGEMHIKPSIKNTNRLNVCPLSSGQVFYIIVNIHESIKYMRIPFSCLGWIPLTCPSFDKSTSDSDDLSNTVAYIRGILLFLAAASRRQMDGSYQKLREAIQVKMHAPGTGTQSIMTRFAECFSASRILRANAGLMLVDRLRRWTNICSTSCC